MTSVAPEYTGFVIAIYLMWKITSNALHGQADTNLKIVATQEQMVSTLATVSTELRNHSESDARVFQEIVNSLQKQTESLIRLEERTR